MSGTTTVADDWTAVADAWDASVDYVEAHSAEATQALIDAVAVRAGDTVVELAAGPGNLGATWARLTGDEGKVILSDIAPGMVEAARRRNADLPNVEVECLDASAIDLPAQTADVVICRMGLMFTLEPVDALREVRRILRPGGRIGALTWAGPEHNPWMACVGMAAMANGLLAGGPPIGPGGVFSLGDPKALAEFATEAGFSEVEVKERPVLFPAESIEAHISRVSSLAGPMARAFAAASEEQLAGVRQTAAQLAAPHTQDDGSLALPGRALLLTAVA